MCRIPGVYLGRGYGHLIITSAVLTALHRYFVCDQPRSFSILHSQALGAAFPLLPIISQLTLRYRYLLSHSGLARGGNGSKVSCGSSKPALDAT